MFAFFEENTLTNPDAIIYVYHSSWDPDFPLFITPTDIEVGLKWDVDGEDVFRKLVRSGFISLDVGVDIEELINKFRDKVIRLKQDLGPYCTINFEMLTKESHKVKYAEFRLSTVGESIDDTRFFLPEYILDFGEYLEEEFTQFYIDSYGFLKYRDTGDHAIKSDLEKLCGGYMILENLNLVLNEYRSPRLLESFTQHIKAIINRDYSKKIATYTVREDALNGVTEFENLLESFKVDFHKEKCRELWAHYCAGKDVFENHNVYQQYTVRFKLHRNCEVTDLTGYDHTLTDFSGKFSYVPNNDLISGSTSFERISWYCWWKSLEQNSISHRVLTPTTIELTFRVYLDFGA